MQTELLIAVMAGVGAMFGWGLADFFAKKTIDEIGDIVSLVWAHIFGTIALLVVAIYQFILRGQPMGVSNDIKTWGLLIFFGVLQAVVYLLVYKGFGKGQVAVLNPVFASFSGIVAILSISIFKEKVSGQLLPALVTIFIGILLISIDLKALRSKKLQLGHIPGLKEVGLATLFAAFWTLFWDKFVGGQNWLSYALLMYTFMTLTLYIVSKTQKINLAITRSGVWVFLSLIGVCEVIAYLSLSIGYSVTTFTSIVALISGAFSLPTIILARVFLKEKVKAIQTLGTLVIIFGIIILSIA